MKIIDSVRRVPFRELFRIILFLRFYLLFKFAWQFSGPSNGELRPPFRQTDQLGVLRIRGLSTTYILFFYYLLNLYKLSQPACPVSFPISTFLFAFP